MCMCMYEIKLYLQLLFIIIPVPPFTYMSSYYANKFTSLRILAVVDAMFTQISLSQLIIYKFTDNWTSYPTAKALLVQSAWNIR